MILLKQILFETLYNKRLITEQQTTTYEFNDSFVDNIVLPIKSKQLNITAFNQITSIGQLTPNLQNFINTLNSAVTAKKLNKGNITITAYADGAVAATKLVPGGESGKLWSQAQVDFSYSNGAPLSNQTLADRRAEGIEFVIRKFVKLPADIKIIKSGNGNGTKKLVTVIAPITTYNLQTAKTSIPNPKTGKQEIFNLAAQKYSPIPYTSATIPVAKCNGTLTANGLNGDPIAFRSKLEAMSGEIIMDFQTAYIPDRLIIIQYDKIKKTTKIVKDTGYMSSDPLQAQVDFGTVLSQLNNSKPNGYTGTIVNNVSDITVNLGEAKSGVEYFIEIYAPLGPTVWTLTINCQVSKPAAANNVIIAPGKLPKVNIPASLIPPGTIFEDNLYWDPTYKILSTKSINKTGDIGWTGTITISKTGVKSYDGRFYIYDAEGIGAIIRIDVYKNNVYTGQGTF